jgi:hypothetical protein
MLIGVVVALATLGIQFGFNLVPSGNGPLRWLALILGQCIGFGLLAAGYIWYAAWQEHKEAVDHMRVLQADAEEFARLQAANTLFKAACRLAQSLHACSAEYPLKAENNAEQFKALYVWYLLLANDSFLTVPPDAVDPLPGEQSEQTHKDITRALIVHMNWLRDYTARLRTELSQRPTIS